MLTKLLSKFLGSGASQSTSAQKKTKLQQAKQAIERLKKLDSFSPIKAGVITFTCSDVDISDFYDRAQACLQKLQTKQLTPHAYFVELRQVNLDRFFTHNNAYVDQRALYFLTQLCEKIIDTVQEGIDKNDSDAQYAERLLGKMFISIIELEKAVAKAI